MESSDRRAHNPFQLPFFGFCCVAGLVMVVGGIISGLGGLVIPGAFAAVASLAAVSMIVRGRGSASWLRSPLDPPAAGDPMRVPRRLRSRLVFVVIGGIAFVVAGVVLIVVGASRGRGSDVFVGALAIACFGAAAVMGIVLLRRSA